MLSHFFRNLALKGLAVGLALLLWFTVGREQSVERGLRVPLEFQNMPEGLEIVSEPPAAADVRVRGASGVVSRLGPGEVVVVLDLRAARPGQRLFHLQSDAVRRPFGIEVLHITPGSVAMEFERQETRVVPIVPAVEGQPAPGYVVHSIMADPASVSVVGPESRVRDLTHATTEPIVVDGAVAPVREEVTVGVADPYVRVGQLRTATVTVEIRPETGAYSSGAVPVGTRNRRAGSTVEVRPAAIAVTASRGDAPFTAAAPGVLEAFVDLAGLGPGRYNLPVRVESAAGVSIDGITPATVRVTIR